MKKVLKYFVNGLKILLVIFVILYGIVYFYVSANKKSIIKNITNQISNKLNGEVSIGDAEISFFNNFPKIAVLLTNVTIKDTLFNEHKHPFLHAEKVYARLSLWKLIKKQNALNGVQLKNAEMYLYTDTAGYTNKYLFTPKKTTTSAVTDSTDKSELNKLELTDMRLVLDDRQKGKLYDFMINSLNANIKTQDNVFLLDVKQKILVHNLVFNTEKGSFIKEKQVEGKYEVRYNNTFKQLQFDSIDLSIGGHPFNLTGRFDIGELAGHEPLMDLRVHTKKIEFEFAKSLLAVAIAKGMSIVTLSSTLDVSASVTGKLKGGEQLVHATWVTKNNDLKNPLLNLEKCSFKGTYTNEVIPGLPRKDPNSKIELKDFTGEWQGLPVHADLAVITDFTDPLLECNITSNFPLSTLNRFFSNSSISLNDGDATINISYKGPIKNNTTGNSFINGTLGIKNGFVNYNPRNIVMKNVNGKIIFLNSDVMVQKLQCQVLGNTIVMDGVAKNLLSLMNTEPNKVVLDWNIYTPSLNLAPFTSLLKARKNMTPEMRAGAIKNFSQKLDEVLEKGRLNVTVTANRLLYKKFEATNALVKITMLENSWLLEKISLQHAGGQVHLNGSLTDQTTNYHLAKINVQVTNVDVSKTFAAFNNFGQDGVTAQSLRGKLTAAVNLGLALDNDVNVYPSSVDGRVNFVLKDGALIDYEPIKKIQDIIFKKRDFANVDFAELKDTLVIKDKEITIMRMEIQSTVLSMFIEGVYSTNGNTDLSIQIPLSNLKRRDSTYVPENMGTDRKGGMSIFLRGTPGADGNVKFKYDMFKRLRKDK